MVKLIYFNIFYDILIKRGDNMKQVKMSNRVYTKDFNVKSLGYCCEEVDAFLDEINMEIVRLEREIEDLNAKLKTSETKRNIAEKSNKDLSLELYNQKAHHTVSTNSSANFNNIDVLNRLANLEKMVQRLLDKNGK